MGAGPKSKGLACICLRIERRRDLDLCTFRFPIGYVR